MISTWGRWQRARTRLRMHSQVAGFCFGLLFGAIAAWMWHRNTIGEIWGSFLVGVAAAIIAAAIFAYLSPFNEPAFRRFLSLSIDDFWPSRQAIQDNYWVDQLHGAQDKCFLLGIAHGGWCKDKRFDSTLRERLNHGLVFKMFFLDPESTPAELRAGEELAQPKSRDTRDEIRESIRTMWELRGKLEPGLKDRVCLYVYTATPSCGLTWIDRTMLVTHYLAGLPDVTSPALLLTPPESGIEGSLYNTYAKNLDKIEKKSILITEENVSRYWPQVRKIASGDTQIQSASTASADGGDGKEG